MRYSRSECVACSAFSEHFMEAICRMLNLHEHEVECIIDSGLEDFAPTRFCGSSILGKKNCQSSSLYEMLHTFCSLPLPVMKVRSIPLLTVVNWIFEHRRSRH